MVGSGYLVNSFSLKFVKLVICVRITDVQNKKFGLNEKKISFCFKAI